MRTTWRNAFELVLVLSACSTSSSTAEPVADAGTDAAQVDQTRCRNADHDANNKYGRALSSQDRTCTTIDDCTLHRRAPSCIASCGGGTAMSKTGGAALDKIIDDIDAHECADFRDAGCQKVPASCPPSPPPGTLACVGGGCTTTAL
jgi:hypothetical protein